MTNDTNTHQFTAGDASRLNDRMLALRELANLAVAGVTESPGTLDFLEAMTELVNAIDEASSELEFLYDLV